MKIKANLLKYKDPNTGSYSPIPVVVSGEDIANKQDKVDNSLNTTDKTIVGSINELSREIADLKQNSGGSSVDLSNYYTKEETDLSFQNALNSVNQMLNSYYTKGEVYNKQEIAELTQQALGELCTEEQVRAIVDEIINEALNSEV